MTGVEAQWLFSVSNARGVELDIELNWVPANFLG
jgi:hypothetical protein